MIDRSFSADEKIPATAAQQRPVDEVAQRRAETERLFKQVLAHARGMLEHYSAKLDEIAAARADSDDEGLACDVQDLGVILLEISGATLKITYIAKGWADDGQALAYMGV